MTRSRSNSAGRNAMKLCSTIAGGLLALAATAAAAAENPAPYAGWQDRDIKALSAQQIDDLRAGRGMSLALAAELNGYPGPRHVLDLGKELGLTAAQRQAFERLFQAMQGEARRLGADILAAEAALDAEFRSGRAAEPELRRQLAALGALRGELRFAHLRSHLTARALLSEAQVARYDALRGYGSGDSPGQGSGHSHGQGHGQGHGHTPGQGPAQP